jgi:hypothetical protein
MGEAMPARRVWLVPDLQSACRLACCQEYAMNGPSVPRSSYYQYSIDEREAMMANQASSQSNKEITQSGQPSAVEQFDDEQSSSDHSAIGDMTEQVSEYVTDTAEQAQEYIREHTGTSVISALVAGFGIGLLVGHAIGGPQREPCSQRYRSMAEGLGTRLINRIEAVMPEALAEHFSR